MKLTHKTASLPFTEIDLENGHTVLSVFVDGIHWFDLRDVADALSGGDADLRDALLVLGNQDAAVILRGSNPEHFEGTEDQQRLVIDANDVAYLAAVIGRERGIDLSPVASLILDEALPALDEIASIAASMAA